MRRLPRLRYPYVPGDLDPFVRPAVHAPEPLSPRTQASDNVFGALQRVSSVFDGMRSDPLDLLLTSPNISSERPVSNLHLASDENLGAPPAARGARSGAHALRPGSEFVTSDGRFDSSAAAKDDWDKLNDPVRRGEYVQLGESIPERWHARRPESQFWVNDSLDIHFEPTSDTVENASRQTSPEPFNPSTAVFRSLLAPLAAYEWTTHAGEKTLKYLPQVLGFAPPPRSMSEAVDAGARNAEAIGSLLPMPGARTPPAAAARTAAAARMLHEVATPPPWASLLLERNGGLLSSEQRAKDPNDYSEAERAWHWRTYKINQLILRLIAPDHPLALRDLQPEDLVSSNDLFALNRAIEETRRAQKIGEHYPGHHTMMDKFEKDFARIGLDRPMRDLFREFMPFPYHNWALHRGLIADSKAFFGYGRRRLTRDDAFNYFRDALERDGLWLPDEARFRMRRVGGRWKATEHGLLVPD